MKKEVIYAGLRIGSVLLLAGSLLLTGIKAVNKRKHAKQIQIQENSEVVEQKAE